MSLRSIAWTLLPLLVAARYAAADPPLSLVLEPVATGLSNPIGLVDAKDGSGRLFVVLQGGQIRVIDDTGVRATPFLNLGALVSTGSERGLLGLAFHPDYESNGRFFVDYTDSAGNTVVARYQVSADPNVADPATAHTVLTVVQPASNHNGGQLQFGPDGLLYIGMGDGGGAGDPDDNGQRIDVLLGKLLRIDVDSAEPYAIPPDNPFVGVPAARPEIWAYGLRNPWRFSFDRVTGDLFIADVGQSAREEIDFEPRGAGGGLDYGWDVEEGSLCYDPDPGEPPCGDPGLVRPVLEYDHSLGCSVTGGFRYWGSAYPHLRGWYLYGDYCSGRIWGATNTSGSWIAHELLLSGLSIASFGEDANGELYVVDRDATSGTIYRITSPRPCDDGLDNDGDGWIDAGDDPGCLDASGLKEDPQCQDGIQNDGDGLVDFDGGESIHGPCTGVPGGCPPGVSDPEGDGVANPDPQCVGKPYRDYERKSGCGLGVELALLLVWIRRRRGDAGRR
jgi:glucose/arabinose dehydrogenase